MPHKHHGGTLNTDKSYNLPPTVNSAAATAATDPAAKKKSKKSRAERDANKNDTPRAFSRLFQPYRPPRSSEDDGTRQAKRRKVTSSQDTTSHRSAGTKPAPLQSNGKSSQGHVQSRSRLREGQSAEKQPRPPTKNELMLRDISKASKSKLERKMQRMQAEWRLEDERMKAKRQKFGEDREGFVDEENVEEMGVEEPEKTTQGVKKRKKGPETDLWAGVGSSRQKDHPPERKGLVGLHDVVQAPPKLRRPAAIQSAHSKSTPGGLKRQAELSEGRSQVIEGYRAMMKQKRENMSEG